MVHVSSFGFRRPAGVPDAVVFDCRQLFDPRGHRVGRHRCGRQLAVQEVVLASPGADELLAAAARAVFHGAPHVAFGCAWGVHRSVSMAEALAQLLVAAGYEVSVEHRDLSWEPWPQH